MIAVAMPGAHLWEREPALDAVSERIARARAGEGGALFVIGEAGLGKTELVARAGGLAAGSFDIGLACGDPMEGGLAFGLAAQAIGGLAGAPSLGRTDGGAPVAETTAPYYRVLRWLETRGDRPLLLALDDLQWADADSLQLVAFVARRLARLRVTVVGALRPWPAQAHDVVRGLVAGGHAQIVRLHALSEPSARELLVDRCGAALSERAAGRAWQLCVGNPLLIEQLALALARGDDVLDGAVASLRPEHLLLARFAGLDAPGLHCARTASVLGTSFRPDVAAEVAGLEDRAADAVLEGLCKTGLLVETGRAALRFAHPLFAQALYDDLSPAVRRRCHARAFTALAGRGLDGEACDHAIAGELIGDADAVAVLERAGRAALAAGAVATSVRDLAAAVRFSADRPDPRLMLVHGEALSASGQIQAAAGVMRALLSRDGLAWRVRLDALRVLGRAHYLTGAADHGDAAFDDAIELAVAHDRPADALRVIEWLEDCARSLPCAWPRIAATLGRAQLAVLDGDDAAAERHFVSALALHDETDLPLHRVEALQAYGGFLRRGGRSVDARSPLVEALRVAERCGAGWLAQAAASELRLAHGKRRSGAEERDHLTPAQQRVAELAAGGASNADIARRLFLSVNTVQTHLTHVYAKLGISSRRELMTRARQPDETR